MPRCSFVIPTYNRAHVLGRALASLQAQTVPDWEACVVDDGSDDDTKGVVERLGDARIRYIAQDNAGASAARNRGLDAAQADIIAYLDSDDTLRPDYLVHVLEARGRYGICSHHRTLAFLNDDGSLRAEKPDTNPWPAHVTLQDFYDWKTKTTSTGLFHRRDMKARWRDVFIEDLEFLMQLAVEDEAGFVHVPHVLADYQQAYNGDGLCGNATYATYAKAFGQIYELHKHDPLMRDPEVYLGRIKSYAVLQARVEAGIEPPAAYKYFPEFWTRPKGLA